MQLKSQDVRKQKFQQLRWTSTFSFFYSGYEYHFLIYLETFFLSLYVSRMLFLLYLAVTPLTRKTNLRRNYLSICGSGSPVLIRPVYFIA